MRNALIILCCCLSISFSATSNTVTLQIDSYVVGGAAAAFQGSFVAGEEAAVVFGPVAASTLTSVQFLYGTSGDVVLKIYKDNGNDDPGQLIFSDTYTLTGSTSAFQQMDLSAENIQIAMNESFRVSIEMTATHASAVAYDNDGFSSTSSNYLKLGLGWSESTLSGITGDWIIRATVEETNVAPVLTAIGNKATDELTELSFNAAATDANTPAQTLTYSLDAISEGKGMTIDASSGAFSWTPTESQGGTHMATITVSDGSLEASEEITITINEVNVDPVLVAIGNKEIDEMVELTFTANASDADLPAQGLTYSLDATSVGKGMVISTAGAFSWTPTEQQDGDHTVVVTVSDGTLADMESITITVNEVMAVVAGLDDADIQSIKLYPNPVSEALYLNIENTYKGELIIKLSDLSGRTMLEMTPAKTSPSWSQMIPIASYKPGIYLLAVIYGETSVLSRVVKK